MKSIDEAPAAAARRSAATAPSWPSPTRLVDGLKTRDELRALMIERGAKDVEHKTFRQISFDDYLARLAAAAHRRRDRRRRRRGRDRRRHRAGRHDRRPLDRRADPQGARRQGHQGRRAARQFARRQRLRLRAGAPRARADARRRQAGGRVDGRPGGLGRLLDLDRRPTRSSPTRAPSPARSA